MAAYLIQCNNSKRPRCFCRERGNKKGLRALSKYPLAPAIQDWQDFTASIEHESNLRDDVLFLSGGIQGDLSMFGIHA